jgi:hypothetical protein
VIIESIDSFFASAGGFPLAQEIERRRMMDIKTIINK